MSLPLAKPLRRAHPRSVVAGLEIKGVLKDDLSHTREPLLIWDISDGGVCLWVSNRFKTGEELQLTIANPRVVNLRGQVRWCKAYEDEGGFLIGVEVFDNLVRLEELHKELAQKMDCD